MSSLDEFRHVITPAERDSTFREDNARDTLA